MSQQRADREQPNIVLVHARDLGPLDGLYRSGADTTNLQRLRDGGITFANAYCAALGSGPAGASMFTGQPAHATGVLGAAEHEYLKEPDRHLARLLQDAGYSTAAAGYQHFCTAPKDLGYQDHLTPNGFIDARDVAEAASLWLRNKKQSPFFLSVGFCETSYHSPGLSWDSVDRWREPSFQFMAQRVDDALGRLLDALATSNVGRGTCMIFTADHGCRLPIIRPEMSDDDIGVPLVVSRPNLKRPGHCQPSLASHLDIVPTVCELAGCEPPPDTTGESLLPCLEGDKTGARTAVFVEVNHLLRRGHGGAGDPDNPLLGCRLVRDRDGNRLLWERSGGHSTVFQPLCEQAPDDRRAARQLREWLREWMKDTRDPLLESEQFLSDVEPAQLQPPRRWVVRNEYTDFSHECSWRPASWEGHLRFDRPIRHPEDLANWIDAVLEACNDDEPNAFEDVMITRSKPGDTRAVIRNTWSLARALAREAGCADLPAEPMPMHTVFEGDTPTVRTFTAQEIDEYLTRLRLWCQEQSEPASKGLSGAEAESSREAETEAAGDSGAEGLKAGADADETQADASGDSVSSSGDDSALPPCPLTQAGLAEYTGVSPGTIREATRRSKVKQNNSGQHSREFTAHEVSQIARARIEIMKNAKRRQKRWEDEKAHWNKLLSILGQPNLDANLKARPR